MVISSRTAFLFVKTLYQHKFNKALQTEFPRERASIFSIRKLSNNNNVAIGNPATSDCRVEHLSISVTYHPTLRLRMKTQFRLIILLHNTLLLPLKRATVKCDLMFPFSSSRRMNLNNVQQNENMAVHIRYYVLYSLDHNVRRCH